MWLVGRIMTTFVVWLVVIWGTFNLQNAASQKKKKMHAHEDLGGGGATDFTKAAPHIEAGGSTELRGARYH
jgi:hypothetical protein